MPRPLAADLDQTASPKTIYRHLIRAAKRHPDSHVALFFTDYWRERGRKLLESGNSEVTVHSRLDRIRKILRKLERASDGIPEDFEWSLKQAYGVSGKARHYLSAPFLSPEVLPKADPIEAGNLKTVPPSYSPILISLLESHVVRDNPILSPQLTVPPTLPAQGIPQNPELYIRPFLSPRLEALRRWEFYNTLVRESTGSWPRTRFPLVVRLLNRQDGQNVEKLLRRIGVEWSMFEDGGRDKVLNWLEVKAGKGLLKVFKKPPRPPITLKEVDRLASLTPSPTTKRNPGAEMASTTVAQSAGPDALSTPEQRNVYRQILSQLPIITIDMSLIHEPNRWFTASLSPWSLKGPAHSRFVTEDDAGWTDERVSMRTYKVDLKD